MSKTISKGYKIPTEGELEARRNSIISLLNQPNYMERIKMEEQGLTWEQLKQKLGIRNYE